MSRADKYKDHVYCGGYNTKIKICGLKRVEDISYVNQARPDYCGFIIDFPKSHRSVTAKQVEELVKTLREDVIPVGVFVNAPEKTAAELFNKGVIRMIQLHGNEDESYISRLRELIGAEENVIIKAFSVKTAGDIAKARQSSADYVLLDRGGGGTGKVFDWSLIASAYDKKRTAGNAVGRPFFLAGGLDESNLETAIEKFHPWAVDLSSSLETDKIKDREKIIRAVNIVRELQRKNFK